MSLNRRKMMGSGERGDKVRTYRFQDNTVKDHRSGKQCTLDKIMSGNFNLLW
jgi:protein subunit release factor A